MQKAEAIQTDSVTTPRDSNSPNARSIVFSVDTSPACRLARKA
jgi:hypothetical protein